MRYWKKKVVDTFFFFYILNYMDKLDLENGVKIGKNVEIIGNCRFGKNVQILGNSIIQDSIIEDNTKIVNSVIVESRVGENCSIGPFAHLRKDTKLHDNVKVGAFVEIKNSEVGEGSKIPHHIYVGDAIIGKRVNVGCGVVFANYDGKVKRQSIIGDDVFIGCNVNIVAPVKIADKTYICAGTTVTKDTEEGDFVIGRVRQENKKR